MRYNRKKGVIMPIDFNPNIMNHYQPQIVNQQYYVQKKELKDTFIKSVDINYFF